jgi:hypothetical protein
MERNAALSKQGTEFNPQTMKEGRKEKAREGERKKCDKVR